MLELLNVRFGFSCRTGHQNAEGKFPIVLRISFRKERKDLFTGIFCFSKDWDTSNERVFRKDKAAITLNDNLANNRGIPLQIYRNNCLIVSSFICNIVFHHFS